MVKIELKLGAALPAALAALLTAPVLGQEAPLYVPAEGYYPPVAGYAPDPYATYEAGPAAAYATGQYPYEGQVPGYDPSQYGYQSQDPAYDPAQYGYQTQAPAYDPAPYGYQGQTPAYDPAPYGYQGQAPAYDPAPYGYQGQAPAYDPAPYGYQGQAPDYGAGSYGQPGAAGGYPSDGYGYQAQPGYGDLQPGSAPAYAQPGYAVDPYAAAPYAMDQSGYYPGFAQQPGYGYAPPASYPGYGSASPFDRFSGSGPWNNLNAPDIFGSSSPFQDPLQHEGQWAKKGFRPWRSGPFAYDKWEDHPATQMPWGNFPGWGKGFFGGYGPDSWEGATPWGNDVPFKWFDPTDPEESVAEIWEDALNAPSKVGRLPPGWTAPYISVPNPIDVENEFERNAMNAPDEIHKMWGSSEGAGFGSDSSDDDEKAEAGEKTEKATQSDDPDKRSEGEPAKSVANTPQRPQFAPVR